MFGRYKKATISILGLYYLNPNLFSELSAPADMDIDLLIDNIIAECAELEIVYPDPEFMQKLIGIWSRKELPVWQKLYDTTQFVYNPIWNVDAHIKETETRDLKNTFSGNEDANGNNTNSKTGYNSNDLVIAERDDVLNNVKRNDSGTDSGTITRETERGGNIGVTSSQSLIQEEREVDKFNIYDVICDSFKRRFCLMIY